MQPGRKTIRGYVCAVIEGTLARMCVGPSMRLATLDRSVGDILAMAADP